VNSIGCTHPFASTKRVYTKKLFQITAMNAICLCRQRLTRKESKAKGRQEGAEGIGARPQGRIFSKRIPFAAIRRSAKREQKEGRRNWPPS
jgi:hypothetical protein